jgi:hypothetical protein
MLIRLKNPMLLNLSRKIMVTNETEILLEALWPNVDMRLFENFFMIG